PRHPVGVLGLRGTRENVRQRRPDGRRCCFVLATVCRRSRRDRGWRPLHGLGTDRCVIRMTWLCRRACPWRSDVRPEYVLVAVAQRPHPRAAKQPALQGRAETALQELRSSSLSKSAKPTLSKGCHAARFPRSRSDRFPRAAMQLALKVREADAF